MGNKDDEALAKVPEVALIFWLIKIAATTLGETAGDAVSMSMGLGYLVATLLFCAVFVVAVAAQILSRRFVPVLYWATIVATTTIGTTLADYVDRSLRIGYAGGVCILVVLLAASLGSWRLTLGSVSIGSVSSPRAEAFYWSTIMFSQTLGTALGDWSADSMGLGYLGAGLIFGSGLAALAALYRWTKASRTALFWAAFILTRPLGAVLGDFLDKPIASGGLALSRYSASVVLLAFIAAGLRLFPQRAARRAH